MDSETQAALEKGPEGRESVTPEQETDAAPSPFTETGLYYLLSAGPWMRFIGIVTFVACGMMLVCGLFMMFGSNRLYNLPFGFLTGLIYVVLAAVCFFPAMFTFLAGSDLCALRKGGGGDALESALKNNKAYWKFCGILTIAGLSLTVLTLIIAVIAVAVSWGRAPAQGAEALSAPMNRPPQAAGYPVSVALFGHSGLIPRGLPRFKKYIAFTIWY